MLVFVDVVKHDFMSRAIKFSTAYKSRTGIRKEFWDGYTYSYQPEILWAYIHKHCACFHRKVNHYIVY